jgi:hypothetical protein
MKTIKPIITSKILKCINSLTTQIFEHTQIDRFFFVSYHYKYVNKYLLDINEKSVAFVELEFCKGIEPKKHFFEYSELKYLGSNSLADFLFIAKNKIKDSILISDAYKIYPEMKLFLDTVNIKTWLYRQVADKTDNHVAAWHFTSSDLRKFNGAEDKYIQELSLFVEKIL